MIKVQKGPAIKQFFDVLLHYFMTTICFISPTKYNFKYAWQIFFGLIEYATRLIKIMCTIVYKYIEVEKKR
jgi:hypothetical protein